MNFIVFIQRKHQNGKIYLSFLESYRIDGKNRHRTIKSLGYFEDLEKEHPDMENYLAQELKKTQEEHYKEQEIEKITITVERNDVRVGKNIGYAIVKKVYSLLEIRKFFNNRTRHMDLNYNLNQVFLLLVLNRFVDPWSKRRAYRKRDQFFERFNFSEQQMYSSLALFSDLSEKLQAFLYQKTQKLVKLDKEVCKYEITNFFFFANPDLNEEDEEGNITNYGIKRYGPSKEGVYRPITQYGLLCDKHGIPLTYNIFSGGRSEKTTFLEIINRSQKTLDIPKIIVIADRGINTSTNMYGLAGDNGAYQGNRKSNDDNIYRTERKDGFIFGQTIRGQSADRINWILDSKGYKEIKSGKETLKFKSRIVTRTIRVNTLSGKKSQRKIRVKELVYYNSIYDRRAKHEREDQLEKGVKLKENPGQYNQKAKRGNGRYVEDNHYAIVNGKKVLATNQELEINYTKAEMDALLDGYYCLVTSELDMPDEEIWANYSELHDIENCFRVSKSEFNLRPVFVWTEKSINAHVLICFVSLLIYRIIQNLTDFKYSTQEIFEAIRSYTLTYGGNGYYLSDEQQTDIIKNIGKIFGLEFKKHFMDEKEIRQLTKY